MLSDSDPILFSDVAIFTFSSPAFFSITAPVFPFLFFECYPPYHGAITLGGMLSQAPTAGQDSSWIVLLDLHPFRVVCTLPVSVSQIFDPPERDDKSSVK